MLVNERSFHGKLALVLDEVVVDGATGEAELRFRGGPR
jgi:hypothetical protein